MYQNALSGWSNPSSLNSGDSPPRFFSLLLWLFTLIICLFSLPLPHLCPKFIAARHPPPLVRGELGLLQRSRCCWVSLGAACPFLLVLPTLFPSCLPQPIPAFPESPSASSVLLALFSELSSCLIFMVSFSTRGRWLLETFRIHL